MLLCNITPAPGLKIVSQHANEVAVICLFDAIPTLLLVLLLLVLLFRPESAAKRIDGLLTHRNVFKGPEIQRAAPVANDKTLARGSSLQPQRRAASFSAPWELSRQPSFPQPAKKRERERKTTTRQRIRRHRLRSRNNFYISIRNEVDATLRILASSVGFGREGLPARRHWTFNGRNVKLKHTVGQNLRFRQSVRPPLIFIVSRLFRWIQQVLLRPEDGTSKT